MSSRMTRALIPLAPGCEEMEAVIMIDVFRRAGWEVVAAGVLGNGPVVCSRGVRLVPDAAWADIDPSTFDVLALPGGGPGTDVLRQRPEVLEAIRVFHASGKTLAAVCAAPLVLQEAGILDGRIVTCHPGVAGELTRAERVDEAVVIDGRLITSQGPGTSVAFALAVVSELDGEEKARAIASEIRK